MVQGSEVCGLGFSVFLQGLGHMVAFFCIISQSRHLFQPNAYRGPIGSKHGLGFEATFNVKPNPQIHPGSDLCVLDLQGEWGSGSL